MGTVYAINNNNSKGQQNSIQGKRSTDLSLEQIVATVFIQMGSHVYIYIYGYVYI